MTWARSYLQQSFPLLSQFLLSPSLVSHILSLFSLLYSPSLSLISPSDLPPTECFFWAEQFFDSSLRLAKDDASVSALHRVPSPFIPSFHLFRTPSFPSSSPITMSVIYSQEIALSLFDAWNSERGPLVAESILTRDDLPSAVTRVISHCDSVDALLVSLRFAWIQRCLAQEDEEREEEEKEREERVGKTSEEEGESEKREGEDVMEVTTNAEDDGERFSRCLYYTRLCHSLSLRLVLSFLPPLSFILPSPNYTHPLSGPPTSLPPSSPRTTCTSLLKICRIVRSMRVRWKRIRRVSMRRPSGCLQTSSLD